MYALIYEKFSNKMQFPKFDVHDKLHRVPTKDNNYSNLVNFGENYPWTSSKLLHVKKFYSL